MSKVKMAYDKGFYSIWNSIENSGQISFKKLQEF